MSNLRTLLHNEIKARQLGELSLEQQKPPLQHRTTPKPDRVKPIPTVQNLTQNTKSMPVCVFCDQQHYSASCKRVLTKNSRQAIVRQKQLCFKCLSNNHMVKECRSTKPCFYCKSKSHHCSLCASQFPEFISKWNSSNKDPQAPRSAQSSRIPPAKGSSQTLSTAVFPASSSKFTVMQTALVTFKEKETKAHLYFDCGSSRSYITTALAQRLNLPTRGSETISSATFESSQGRSHTYPTAVLPVPTNEGGAVELAVLIPLADPPPEKVENVTLNILVGADYYFKLINKERIELDDDISLLDSKLGYIVTGVTYDDDSGNENSFTNSVTMFHNAAVSYRNNDIERLWKMEDIGIKENYQESDDDVAVHQFNKFIKLQDGRYEVAWPYKEGCEDLPTNRNLALRRLRVLVKRLKGDEKLLEAYVTTINSQLVANIIETVPQSHTSQRIHYLPHHPVCRPDKTTKIRIIFDASSKEQRHQLALNECLLRGPVFLEDLCSLLIRFRSWKYAVTADIEKAFLQVGLREEDRDVTRFLWIKNMAEPIAESNVVEYRFRRVLFGIISSPFLLDATIKHHLRSQNTQIANFIANNIYVDNVVGGRDTERECTELYNEARRLFSNISMNIREWYTNSTKVSNTISGENLGKTTVPKVLGMQWDTHTDKISCAPVHLDRVQVTTKKQLVQAVSSTFDPCGFFSPVTVIGRAMIQSLWKLHLKWDDRLPNEIKDQWNKHKLDLQRIEEAAISRFVPLSRNRELSHIPEIHIFCDASTKAYAAVVYLKPANGTPHLLFSKTRLAPLKELSLPRLELMAVLLGARAATFVKRSLESEGLATSLWSDSKCSVYWLQSPKVLATFISNRVREVKRHCIDFFRYIPSDLNPADVPSRGSTFNELINNVTWWNGPSLLTSPENSWPSKQFEVDSYEPPFSVNDGKEESQLCSTESHFIGPAGMDANNYSTLRRLLRVTAYVLRFIGVTRQTTRVVPNTLSADEIAQVLALWTKQCQQWHHTNIEQTQRKTLHRQLGLFTDQDGTVRCRGRLECSALPYETKYPALIPRGLRFTSLLIMDVHHTVHHGGVSNTLAELRRRFWVPHGRAEVKKAISRCLICRKWEGKPYPLPAMGPLPSFRVSKTRPFQNVGIDYAGPLFAKSPDQSSKCWICLITCTSTRAIHLELIPSMTADDFLLALRRFIALCGKPDVIISDNARQFKTAHRALDDVWRDLINNPQVTNHSTTTGITWKFIPDYSPWMGGFYERLVADVKRALKKTLGSLQVTYQELQALAYEIAWVINTRPLVPPGDINDPVLTPAHLLGRFPDPGVPCISEPYGAIYAENMPQLSKKLSERWKRLTRSLDYFWNLWQSSYLTSLRERSTTVDNYNTSQEIPTVGPTVLIKATKNIRTWQIARISKLNVSKDGKIRSVTLRLPNGKSATRPVSLVYPLECDDENTSSLLPNAPTIKTRPKRKAAIEAQRKVRYYLESEESD